MKFANTVLIEEARRMAERRGHKMKSRQVAVLLTMLAHLIEHNDLKIPPAWMPDDDEGE